MDLTLVSIVVGLGLTELLLTFYQLFRARRRVEWDVLPLAWAALLLIVVVNYWWGIRAIMAHASGWFVAWLEGLIHPRVVGEYLAWRDELATQPSPPAACVTEVPLLYEVGGETRFDVVVVVTAPRDVRIRRSRLAADPRASRLIPDEEKVARADFAFVNDGSLAELDSFVADVLEQLDRRA